jgi:Glycosyltransferase family 17
VRRWDTFMFRDEADVLEFRLAELASSGACHVLSEARVTHRGVPKPLHYQENTSPALRAASRVLAVTADLDGITAPWAREHAQRDAAWHAIAGDAADDDIVYICDADEIPSAQALAWDGQGAVALWMRTTLYAVDWVVPDSHPLPPTAVAARAGWLRAHGGSLSAARDNRGAYPVIRDGGWHHSWLGGPARQREKLETATCHTELLDHPEAQVIRSGARYYAGEDGGGIPVVPADVDGTWPAYIAGRRCPPEWFRPRPAAVP